MGKNVTLMGLENKEKKKELKKHAATIHCSNSLSLLQRKITNALLYHAYKELLLKEEHEITVKQLCRLIGYQGNNHSAIKDALKELISTVIEWNVINDETGAENWTASSILASVSLEGPLCYYAYSPRMKQLLHSPSMFGKIDLVIQSRFRSTYGLALYENCTRYRGLPKTKWFDIELFKKLMGVPANKYDVFRDFKRRVLDKAIDEVNTYSDLIIGAELVREGRKVIKLRFKLKERAKKTRLGEDKQMQEINAMQSHPLLLKLMSDFNFSRPQATQLMSEYDVPFIQDKISMIESSKAFLAGKIDNLTGYLLTAIKQNYQQPKMVNAPEKMKDEADFVLELAALKKQIECIWLDYHTYRDQAIQEAIEALAGPEKDQFMAQFYQYAEPAMCTILKLQHHQYTRGNILKSPQMQALLRQFALRELDFIAIHSLEEFVVLLGDEKISAWQKFKSYDPEHPFLHSQD